MYQHINPHIRCRANSLIHRLFQFFWGTLIAASISWAAQAQTQKLPEIGDILCTDGSFVPPAQWADATNKTAHGVVFWVNPSIPTKGLAVALKDLGNLPYSTKEEDVPSLLNKQTREAALHDFDGRANTAILRALPKADYPAAHAISDAEWDNGWYLPALGELRLLYAHYAMVEPAIKAIAARNNGLSSTMRNRVYRSSTEYDKEYAWFVYSHGASAYESSKRFEFGARAVLAFMASTQTQPKKALHVGDSIHFADGDVGVVCFTSHGGTRGWAMALRDQNNGTRYSWASAFFETATSSFNVPDCQDRWEAHFQGLLNVMDGSSAFATLQALPSADYPAAHSISPDSANRGWYLPSIGQLQLLWGLYSFVAESLAKIENAEPLAWCDYWSSIPVKANEAWSISEWGGVYPESKRDEKYKIRTVRNFVRVATQYTISTTALPAEGGTVAGASTHSAGTTATLTATPAEGYRFVRWTVGGAEVSTSPTYSFIVSGDAAVVAEFELLTYKLIYIAGANGSITGITSQVVAHGHSGTEVEALPDAGYRFKQWSDGRTDTPRTDNNVAANIIVTAEFEQDAPSQYTISTTAHPAEGGTVAGAGAHSAGTTATLTATPAEGYRFVHWDCNGIELSAANPLDITVTADSSLVAVFERATGLRNVQLMALMLRPNPTLGELWLTVPSTGSGPVEGTAAAEVLVYSINGQLALRVPHAEGFGRLSLPAGHLRIDLSGLPTGVYVVRLGNAAAKVVRL